MHTDSTSPPAPLPDKSLASNPYTENGPTADWDDSSPPPSDPPDTANSARSWLLDIGTLITKRLAFAVLVMLIIVYVTFLGMAMAQGHPLSLATSDAFSSSIAYLQRLLTGDVGMSHAVSSRLNLQPVEEHLGRLLGRSLGLLGVSLALATIIGSFLGLRAALQRHSNRSLMLILASIIGVSAPSFFIAIILQQGAILWTRTSGSRLLPVGGFGWDSHMILPVIVLAARPIAQIARVAFVSLSSILDEEFVRTARSKGIRFDSILRRHVYRNAAIPILTTVGISLRYSLSTLPVVEFFFGWNGAGQMLLRAISFQDHNLAIALLLSFGALFIGTNLLLDLIYRIVDPRLSSGDEGTQQQLTGSVRDFARELLTGLIEWFSNILKSLSDALHNFVDAIKSGQFLRSKRPENTDTPSNSALRKVWRNSTIGNPSLMLGGLVVLALLVIYFFGPQLAPHSPYTTIGIEYADGKLTLPPFEPNGEYPWGTDVMGRDIMSLVLAGTQQTLRLAALVVAARIVIGFLLGTLAGWFRGRWLDRVILSLSEVIAAFPTLLLAMLLILSLGIRSGFRPFLIALSLVGWSEIMQFVRSETITTRPKLFIESAISIGAGTPRLIFTHLLPNLLPALISLAALEMGAVLMLLGELGYIGIFIGGGAFAELNVAQPRFQYSDVPEWGSLLSNVRLYARVYPWTAIYPALAFFIAILGFNLLSEGLRRLVENVGGHLSQIWNRYTVIAVLLLLFGVGWLRSNTGPMAYYREQAVTFQGDIALESVEALTQPQLMGGALGSPGMRLTADYIAEEFRTLGLQKAGEEATYFQTRQREFQQLDSVPQLAISVSNDGSTSAGLSKTDLLYRQDFREFAGLFRIQGSAEGQVHFLATGPLQQTRSGVGSQLPRPLRDVDFSESILMVLTAADAIQYSQIPYRGILVVADEGEQGPQFMAQSETLPAHSPVRQNFGGREIGQEAPIFWITPDVANRILSSSGNTVANLRNQAEGLGPDQLLTFPTDTVAKMRVEGTTYTGVDVVNVIGHLPAIEGQGLGGQMIVVMAPYDSPPLTPDAAQFPAANDNASGLALMLEVIRTLAETRYEPYKTFLFVAYPAEGTSGGEQASPPDVEKFLEAKNGFKNNFEIEAVITLQGIGGGSGDRLAIEAGGSLRLADLFADAAKRVGVSTVRVGTAADLSTIFEAETQRGQSQSAPQVALHWEGWEETARTINDTVDGVQAETLAKAGKAVTLALMTIGRETQY